MYTVNTFLKCEPCCMVFTAKIHYEAHMNSEKHKQNVTGPKAEMSCRGLPQCALDPYIRQVGREYMCIKCNITLNSIEQAKSHSTGKKHKSSFCGSSCASNISKDNSVKSILDSQYSNTENVMTDVIVFNVNDPVEF